MATAIDPVESKLKVIKALMPLTHKAIQAKAAAMGNEAYALVRRALRGEAGCFYAIEAGHVVGTPLGLNVPPALAVVIVQYGVGQGGMFVLWPDMGAGDGAD